MLMLGVEEYMGAWIRKTDKNILVDLPVLMYFLKKMHFYMSVGWVTFWKVILAGA